MIVIIYVHIQKKQKVDNDDGKIQIKPAACDDCRCSVLNNVLTIDDHNKSAVALRFSTLDGIIIKRIVCTEMTTIAVAAALPRHENALFLPSTIIISLLSTNKLTNCSITVTTCMRVYQYDQIVIDHEIKPNENVEKWTLNLHIPVRGFRA